MAITLAQKIFTELYERLPHAPSINPQKESTEGIITSVNEFLTALKDAHSNYNKVFNIPESDQLVIVEDAPRELVIKINNQTANQNIDESTLRDVRIVTYSANESPAVLSAHRINEDGVRSLKYRLIGTYDDPEYTGYSVLRFGKEIEAIIDFNVWGVDFFDVRNRSKLLRSVIDDNVWYFKHKGLRELIWMGSSESSLWDNKTLMKMKSEKYLIRFTEIKETREKNLEQIIVQAGLDE